MISELNETNPSCTGRRSGAEGFSLMELLVVASVIIILTAISVPYLFQYQKLYRSEEQARKIMDLMQEASQLALNKRRTMRVEIDLTDNAVLLIDENTPGTASDDTLVKSSPLFSTGEIRVDTNPSGVTSPNPPNYAGTVFANDTLGHKVGSTTVSNNNVWAARFRSDGSTVSATNVPVSATIFLWPPRAPGDAAARDNREVRAVTLFGGSGAVRYWKYNGASWGAF